MAEVVALAQETGGGIGVEDADKVGADESFSIAGADVEPGILGIEDLEASAAGQFGDRVLVGGGGRAEIQAGGGYDANSVRHG